MRRFGAAAMIVLSLGALGALSRVPYGPAIADGALLRLTWRSRGLRVETCRVPTEEELARVPVHMRQQEICEGGIVPYSLRVAIDGVERLESLVRSTGARSDRPLYVFAEVPIEPGRRDVAVTFAPLPDSVESVVPDTLVMSLARSVDVEAGAIVLVTADQQGRLILRAAR